MSALSALESSLLGAFKAWQPIRDLPSPANKGIMFIKNNGRILTNKETYAIVEKTHHNRDNKVTYITLVWACTESGRKWNSQNSIIYEYGNNKTER
jgi:hypothetical protein